MLRVLFVHPFDTICPGGAEQSLRQHINAAPAGVEVTSIDPAADCDVQRFDAVVLGNLRPAGGAGAEAELMWILRWASRLTNYRGFALRSERDVHPCTHRDGRCLVGRRPRKIACDCSHTQRDACQLLYSACSAVQFLSPAHQRAINALIPIACTQHVIASPVDLDQFQVTVPFERRPAKALILGDAIRVAGSAEARARRAGYEPEQLEYLSVPFDEMPKVFNRYQAVVIDPVMFHAFGRIAVEALACGCHVLASERVGAMSWPDPLAACRAANRKFWSVVLAGCQDKSGRRFGFKLLRQLAG